MATGIITAAGAGARLGLGIQKLEAGLLGRPLVTYALLAFEEASSIESVVLVVPAARLSGWGPARLREMGVAKVAQTVAGGETRQESVRLALDALAAREGLTGNVVVHDGARPLVTPSLIDAVSDVPEGFDGVVAAVPVTDTVKEVDSGVVVGTPDRDRLVAVQTPQAFRAEVLAVAHREALAYGYTGTDDSSLVERAGGRVLVVRGSVENIKVTNPGDLERAGEMLKSRGKR